MRNRLARVAAALAAVVIAPSGFGLGFGGLEVNSALNQPLDAEILLLAVKPGERDNVKVTLASAKTYERFGIERPATVEGVRVEVVPGADDNRMRVLLTSRQPMRDPFLTLLLEARWSGNRALREYTVLLDPPVETPTAAGGGEENRQSEPAPAPTATSPAAADRDANRGADERQSSQPSSAPESTQRAAAPRTTYGPVRPNQTLWSIAQEVRPARDISMDQMMLALYQANVEHFDGNINLMHKGATLDVPPADEIRAIDAQVAADEVDDQMQARTAATSGARSAETESEESGAAEGVAAADDGGGQLRLEPAGESDAGESGESGTVAPGGDSSGQAVDTTKVPSTDPTLVALAETARSRNEAEAAPNRGDTSEDAGSGDAGTAEPAAADSGEPDPGADADSTAAEDDAVANDADPADADTQGAADGSGQESGSADNDTGTPADAGSSAVDDSPVESVGSDNAAAGEQVETAAESVVPEGAGLLTPRRLLLVLAAILLVFCLVLVLRRRQYKPMPADFSGLESEDGSEATPVAPAAAAPSAEAISNAEPEGPDADEVLDDADSLMENELHNEAIGAVELGLEAHPDDPRLRHKLLEAHYAAGNRDAFVAAVHQFHPSPDPDDAYWPATAAMGREMAPDEPMFAFATVEQAAEADPEPEAFERPAVEAGEPESATPDFRDVDAGAAMPDEPRESAAHTPAYEAGMAETSSPEAPDKPADDDGGDTEELERLLAFDADTPAADTPAAMEEPGSETVADDGRESGDRYGQASPDSDDSEDFGIDLQAFASEAEDAEAADDWRSDSDPESASDGDRIPDVDLLDKPAASADAADAGAGQNIPQQDDPSEPLVVDPAEFGLDETPEEAGGPEATEPRGGPRLEEFDLSGISLDDSDSDDAGSDAGVDPAPADAPDDAAEGRIEPPETEASEGGLIADDAGLESEIADDAAADSGADTADDADGDEVETKLDLARAYLDMGEAEMAASLLEEVQSQGDEAQQQQAASLMTRTG